MTVLLATGARLTLLIIRPPWHDELFTVWASRLPLSGLLEALRHDSGPPLFYLLEKPFVRIAEITRTDTFARLLPFLAVACLFGPAFRLPSDRAAARFAALAAASPLLLVYAAEARAYGLLALLDFALFLLLFRGEPSPARLAGAAALTALALWTHYLAILFVAACALTLLARRRLTCLAAVAVGGLAFLPWVGVLEAQPEQATAWMREPAGDSLLSFVSALGGAGRVPTPQGGPLPGVLVVLGVLVGVLLLFGVARAGRRDSECADAAAVTLLTMALVLAFSWTRPVAFPGRSELAILPVWLWSVSRASASEGFLKWITVPLMAVALAAAVFLMAAPKPEPLSSRVVAEVARTAEPSETVVASGAFYLPARLAADRGKLKAEVIAYPLEDGRHPGWFEPRLPAPSDERRLEEKVSRAPSGARIFLVLYPHQYQARLRSFLASRGTARELLRRPDCLLIVWSKG